MAPYKWGPTLPIYFQLFHDILKTPRGAVKFIICWRAAMVSIENAVAVCCALSVQQEVQAPTNDSVCVLDSGAEDRTDLVVICAGSTGPELDFRLLRASFSLRRSTHFLGRVKHMERLYPTTNPGLVKTP